MCLLLVAALIAVLTHVCHLSVHRLASDADGLMCVRFLCGTKGRQEAVGTGQDGRHVVVVIVEREFHEAIARGSHIRCLNLVRCLNLRRHGWLDWLGV